MIDNQSSLAAMASAGAPHRLCYLTGQEDQVNPLDMAMHSAIAEISGGISPVSVITAWSDWAMHFAISPGKQIQLISLMQKQALNWMTLHQELLHKRAPENVPASDRKDTRFTHQSWSNWPFNAVSRAFLQEQQLVHEAISGVRGVTAHHERVVDFMARQILDMVAPSNYPWLNPEVMTATAATAGKNLFLGAENWMRDVCLLQSAQLKGTSTQALTALAYQPGRDVAVTPGKVVFRNDLIELIQYAPQTESVFAEPILIVPSWIMKFYILDLSPHNSLVRFLVEQGHTVFMISWKNPGKEERDLGMHDYIDSGLFAALLEVANITHNSPVHTVGYCLGGTLLAIGIAALASHASSELGHAAPPIKSVSLLAAQTDFNEPGELGLFIDESQLAMLDSQMWEQGYLDGDQMAKSFQLLNSRDLFWSKIMREYQLGVRSSPNDLMSWNADATRLPYRMHSEYLKHLFLHNDLAENRYEVGGIAVSLHDIHVPMFVVGTAHDHVSPWHSVFKINALTDAPVDFVLASDGHNAGIVSEPGHADRSFQYLPDSEHREENKNIDAQKWLHKSATAFGSWWPHWQRWLMQHSSVSKISATEPKQDLQLGDAPGKYVLER